MEASIDIRCAVCWQACSWWIQAVCVKQVALLNTEGGSCLMHIRWHLANN